MGKNTKWRNEEAASPLEVAVIDQRGSYILCYGSFDLFILTKPRENYLQQISSLHLTL